MVRSPVVSIMMLEIGVTRPGIRTMALPSMPSRARSSKICSAAFSPAWPIGPDIRTRPPSRAMAMEAFSALPPLYSVKCVARILLPRAGIFSTRNTRSRTGIPTQRIFGAASRGCAVMRVPPNQTEGKQPKHGQSSLVRRHAIVTNRRLR
ncbi:hypothetical protein BN961_04094 [Afipia felis]|uniref:Uncharacterized protein n=1 Tax=Afipia felis TaxID=1035 RepID=A0A090MWH3_AFIFE|nr:hypothetical protein BN961_04094 [Afipia felis]